MSEKGKTGRDQESTRAISGVKSLLFMMEAVCEPRQVAEEGGWCTCVSYMAWLLFVPVEAHLPTHLP